MIAISYSTGDELVTELVASDVDRRRKCIQRRYSDGSSLWFAGADNKLVDLREVAAFRLGVCCSLFILAKDALDEIADCLEYLLAEIGDVRKQTVLDRLSEFKSKKRPRNPRGRRGSPIDSHAYELIEDTTYAHPTLRQWFYRGRDLGYELFSIYKRKKVQPRLRQSEITITDVVLLGNHCWDNPDDVIDLACLYISHRLNPGGPAADFVEEKFRSLPNLPVARRTAVNLADLNEDQWKIIRELKKGPRSIKQLRSVVEDERGLRPRRDTGKKGNLNDLDERGTIIYDKLTRQFELSPAYSEIVISESLPLRSHE